MDWQNEYTKLLIERLEFNDFSLKPGEDVTIKDIYANFKKRISLLFEAASTGDPVAKSMYLSLCEDFLRTVQGEFKSSSAYQEEHASILKNLEKLV